ncbi:hypothetical protein [Micromonospora sp. WMMD737]|uniref:hypothetical protein n=1 Tax=Micromonospora sp. WMMD737 TaxID=3404113 RepID=UPI003B95EA74
MRPESDRSLLVDLARPLVEQFSPAETELFPLLSEAHFADPRAYGRSGSRRSDPLGFGLPEVLVLLTPVALAAMTEVVRYVVERGMRRGQQVTAVALRRVFRDEPPAVDAPPIELTSAEWAEVRRIVERVAVRGGVEPARAALIADAVVGQGRLADEPR